VDVSIDRNALTDIPVLLTESVKLLKRSCWGVFFRLKIFRLLHCIKIYKLSRFSSSFACRVKRIDILFVKVKKLKYIASSSKGILKAFIVKFCQKSETCTAVRLLPVCAKSTAVYKVYKFVRKQQ
jgi:hypothetical protein